jgi:iron complex outermembrane recepter protein
MFKHLPVTLLLLLGTFAALAQTNGTVTGKVLEVGSNEPLFGVSVLVVGTSKGAIVDLDGRFEIKNVAAGKQTLRFSYVGYEDVLLDVQVTAGQSVSVGEVTMESNVIGLKEVEVFANVVEDRKTPVAVSSIGAIEINQQLGGMELPELLNATPGIYATQGSGTYGDARLNIRGFGQEEVLFMINGVPLNDMENGFMYWSNFAGLSEITRSMQVQRGLGASKLGVNSVGGTVNIVTKPSEKKKGGRAEYMFGNGSWNDRYRLTLNSGAMKGGWSVAFQGSRTTGEGYRPGAFVDAWSYFLNASKEINQDHTLIFTVFGAPVNRGRAFNTNTTEYELRNDYWFNPSIGYYNGRLYNASQNKSHKPQASAMWIWTASEKITMTTSAYASVARVYGTSPVRALGAPAAPGINSGLQNFNYMVDENDKNFQVIENAYGIPGRTITGDQSRYIIEARYNNHNWYGAISNLQYQFNDNTSLVVGVDFRDYTALHYGEVFDLLGGSYWLDKQGSADMNLLNPTNVARVGDRINYDYDGNVRWASGFAQFEKTMGKFDVFVSGNFASTQMWRVGNFWDGRNANINKSFGKSDVRVFNNFNLKGGVNYRLDGRQNVFANAGYFTRAPFMRNSLENDRYSNTFLRGLKSEEIRSTELGYSYRTRTIKASFNAYYTQWFDKAFSFFIQNPEDAADRTYFSIVGQGATHKGLELELQYEPFRGLQLRGMASVGDWKWTNNVNATLADDFGNVSQIRVFSQGLPVGDAAQTTAFVGAHYSALRDLYFGARFNYFGRLYESYDPSAKTSEFASPVRRLPDYTILDVYAGYYFSIGDLRSRIGFNIHNLLDERFIRRSDERFGGEDYGFGINYNTNITIFF